MTIFGKYATNFSMGNISKILLGMTYDNDMSRTENR